MTERIVPRALLEDLRRLIAEARLDVARTVNSTLVVLYWNVGERIRKEILKETRAEYGKQIFYALSRKLSAEFGKGFSQANLFHMVRFAEVFPESQIVHALRGQLAWTHIRQIIYLHDPLRRQFYTEMCRLERWSTRTLQAKINGMLFERTALSKKPDELAQRRNAARLDLVRRQIRRAHLPAELQKEGRGDVEKSGETFRLSPADRAATAHDFRGDPLGAEDSQQVLLANAAGPHQFAHDFISARPLQEIRCYNETKTSEAELAAVRKRPAGS
jgi:hypothetical protein